MKKIIVVVFTVLCCIPIFTTHTKATESSYAVVSYSDIKEWKYKLINGQLYKRLFNASQNRWEGSWIKVS